MKALGARARLAVALLTATLMLSGCDFDVYKLPLPGGADTGSDPIEVKVQFDDVLDLVPKSSVKVNDVTVGQVSDVDLEGDKAVVTLKLRKDVDLPDQPVASIRQTSLLGEKFVSLAAPTNGGQGRLSDGDVIKNGGRNPEVEDVLGALSLVLNGGGIAQLKTISSELNKALDGREDSAKSVLTQVRSLVQRLDERKGDIVAAIESVNRLAISARQHQDSIDRALEELPSALDSLDRQRGDLVKMLDGLTKLSNVGVRVIRTTQASTVSTLKSLDPILTQIAKAGDNFTKGFSTFLTYPFIDEAVGRNPQTAKNLHMGDYVNLSVDLQLDLGNLRLPDIACIPIDALPDLPLDTLVDLKTLCSGVTQTLQACLRTPPNAAACLALPQRLVDNVCAAVDLPILCAARSGGAGTRGTKASASSDPIKDLLSGVLSGGGLGRPQPGATDKVSSIWRDFDDAYDADLVDLYSAALVAKTPARSVTR